VSAPSAAAARSAPSRAPSAAPAQPSRPLDSACKAAGKKGSTELSPIPEVEVQLVAAPDALYALGFTHDLARSRLYRFSRAGGPVEMVAEQKGLGVRKHLTVSDGAGYYVQSGKLIRLGPESGESSVLHSAMHSPVAVVGDRVLGVACDSKAKVDRLLELPTTGGEPQLVAELPRSQRDGCQYSSVVADERDVFIADWNAQAIVAVSRADKQVRRVVSKRGFPGGLLLEPDALVYSSTAGIQRVARDGSSPVVVADTGVAYAPFSTIASNSSAYFAVDNIAYALDSKLRRMPREGGAPQILLVLKSADPEVTVEGQGFWDFVVDEQCAYIAQTQYKRSGVQIVVKPL
jgi:hypothetical protein